MGFKWARLESGLGVGVETLLLLPVQTDQSGSGIESQFLTTLQRELWEVHLNAGGFNDPRSSDTERGWRASVLAEFPRERLQPGIEVFARNVRSEGTRVQLGIGVIKEFERFEVRTAIQLGLNDRAPDVEAACGLRGNGRPSAKTDNFFDRSFAMEVNLTPAIDRNPEHAPISSTRPDTGGTTRCR